MRRINPNLLKLAELTHNPNLKVDEAILEEIKEPIKRNDKFSLEDLTDFYRINGVNYRDGVYTVDLLKGLLDNGNSKTQDKWVEYSRKAQQNNDFYVGDFSLYFAIKHSLYQNRNGEYKVKIENARQFLKQQMFDHWLITLTRINYRAKGKDKVVHNFGMPYQYEISGDIVGPDEWVKNSNNNDTYKAILGTNNIKEINEVYKWLTDVNACLWRVNNKPPNVKIDCFAGFSADSDCANLNCDGNPGGLGSSLGVFLC